MAFCSYFQARIEREQTWLFVALLRSNEHLCFDRTLDTQQGLFEFFVPEKNVSRFITLMRGFEAMHLLTDLQALPNRLAEPGAVL